MALYSIAKARWVQVCLKNLASHFHINPSMAYFYSVGHLKRRGRRYRWYGPKPTKALVEAWSDYLMNYQRRHSDRSTAVGVDYERILDSLKTSDNRAQHYESMLNWCFRRLHRGYTKINLTDVFERNRWPHKAIQLLMNKGHLMRGRIGVYKWVGPPPDRELTLWLFGMLAEHHRAIYRSKMEEKVRRTKLVDDLIGRAELPSSESVEVEPKEGITATKSSYWSQGTSTW